MGALLHLNDVESSYGASQVLFGMSLEIQEGEMITLLGRNGMGKTTTVRTIMGLVPAHAGARPSTSCRPLGSPSSASAWFPKAARYSRI